MKVGLIGLGAMGLPMGRRLLAAGHDLAVVPHLNRAPAEELGAGGAEIRSSASELRSDREVVITSVPDVPQVEEVLFGEHGLTSGTQTGNGLLYVDMSTINPTAARNHHTRLADAGIEA